MGLNIKFFISERIKNRLKNVFNEKGRTNS